MIEIIPAILPLDYADLREKVSRVSGATSLIQIDICDGKFVPSSTWPNGKHDRHFEAMLHEEEGLPEWETIDAEIDLMVSNPADVAGEWITVGAKRLVFHFESVKDFGAMLADFIKEYGRAGADSFAPEIGVALNVDTPNDAIEPFVNDVDFVQFMGIARIGFQGQPFDERVLEKIRTFHAKHPDKPISVDGGVDFDTAPVIAEAGATRLVSGSAILENENPLEAIHELEAAAERLAEE